MKDVQVNIFFHLDKAACIPFLLDDDGPFALMPKKTELPGCLKSLLLPPQIIAAYEECIDNVSSLSHFS